MSEERDEISSAIRWLMLVLSICLAAMTMAIDRGADNIAEAVKAVGEALKAQEAKQ